MENIPTVQLNRVSKSFGDARALDDVSLNLKGGEVTAVVGHNGSGKSTLTNVLCGNVVPDSGSVMVEGVEVELESPAMATSVGVRILPQSLEIYPSLSVLENIFMGQELVRGFPFFRLMDWKKMRIEAKGLLSRVGADRIEPDWDVTNLSGGQKKSVVLARLLAKDSKVLVFDEPMTALGVRQKKRLLEIMRTEAARGVSVLFVSHDAEDVITAADRVVLLKQGKIVSDSNRGSMSASELAIEMSLEQ